MNQPRAGKARLSTCFITCFDTSAPLEDVALVRRKLYAGSVLAACRLFKLLHTGGNKSKWRPCACTCLHGRSCNAPNWNCTHLEKPCPCRHSGGSALSLATSSSSHATQLLSGLPARYSPAPPREAGRQRSACRRPPLILQFWRLYCDQAAPRRCGSRRQSRILLEVMLKQPRFVGTAIVVSGGATIPL